MLLKELLTGIDILKTNTDLSIEIKGIGCDSRFIRPGELFIAVEGYTADGHSYINDAAGKGASCVVSRKIPETDIPYVIVENTRIAQAMISAAWFGYPAKRMKLIGVTGTNGKTSVTYLIKHIIEKCSTCKAGLVGTIENLIGSRQLASNLTTPDSYELHSILNKMAFEGCEYVIMEVSSHALYLQRVYGLEFEIGIFTNLTPEHMDFHVSMDDYADAKAMLFPNCRNSVINVDDKYAGRMITASKGNIIRFSAEDTPADVSAKNIQLYSGKTEFDIYVNGQATHATLHIPGRFSVYNALAAVSAGLLIGYEIPGITDALFTCPGVRGRAEVLPTGMDFTVMLDYAHKPDALDNIIRTARSMTQGRVLTLFGCGGDRDKTKRPVMGRIAMDLSDVVIITSDNPRTEKPEDIIEEIVAGIKDAAQLRRKGRLKVTVNRREAICQALDLLLLGDVLIIAGKGHENYQIIGKKKTHFDDREIVNGHLMKIRENRRRIHAHIGEID